MALSRSVPIWAAIDAVRAIVVVTWESEPAQGGPGGGWARMLLPATEKLSLVEAGDGEAFRPGLARNLGLMAAAGSDIVLCLDPDIVPRDPGDALPVLGDGGRAFVTVAGAEPARSAAQCLFRRATAAAAGDFHEYLVGRGFEGEEFATRLVTAGLAHRFFGPDALVRLPEGASALPDDAGAPDFPLPPGLWRASGFIEQRNRILGGIAPWNAALAALRPRRIGGAPNDRVRRAELAPQPAIERHLLDWSSFIAARFGHGLDGIDPNALLSPLLAGREAAYRERAARQHQIERARAASGITAPWR